MTTDTTTGFSRRDVLAAGAALATLALAPAAQAADGAPKSRLTTHVLDTYNGRPGGGMRIDFLKQDGERYVLDKTVSTNAEGRVDTPLLPVEGAAAIGRYQLVFHVAEYFAANGAEQSSPPFLDKVTLEFAIFEAEEHYHVPLLCSPWSYTTYRGS